MVILPDGSFAAGEQTSPKLAIEKKESVARMQRVAVKWVNRLFTKNTALCQVVKTTYRV